MENKFKVNDEVCGKELENTRYSFKADGDISDGYHTFTELYHHRSALFCALLNSLRFTNNAWKSELHSDGTMFDGMFVAGMELENC